MELDEWLTGIASLLEDDWRPYAACKPEQPDSWFFDDLKDEGLAGPNMMHLGRQVCVDCATRIECLDNALVHADQGIRMGLDDDQRNSVARFRVKYRPYFKVDMNLAIGDLLEVA